MIRRAAGFGMHVVLWSRRFDGRDRPMTDQRSSRLGLEHAMRSIAIDLAPTPATSPPAPTSSASTSRSAAETKGSSTRDVLGATEAGPMVINTARGEVVDHSALRRR